MGGGGVKAGEMDGTVEVEVEVGQETEGSALALQGHEKWVRMSDTEVPPSGPGHHSCQTSWIDPCFLTDHG